MDEGIIRMQAQMYALIAEIESIKAHIKSMEYDNLKSISNKEDLEWSGLEFRKASNKLKKLSYKFKTDI